MASYIESTLISGETVLHRGRTSKWTLAPLILLGIITIPIIVGIFILIAAYIKLKTTELAITNKRLIAKFGFISRHTIEINLAKVESIQVNQTLPARIFNFGTLFISGGGNPIAPIPNVADPLLFRKKFMEAIDALPKATAPQP